MEKDIYKLELHKETQLGNNLFILRVAGGWIYTMYCMDNVTSVFVPFNNEFQLTPPKTKD